MATGVIEFTVSIAGLLLAAKAAVDGFNLAADLYSKEDGAYWLALQYDTEKYILECWTNEVRRRHKDGFYHLVNLPSPVRQLIERHITAIRATQDRIETLTTRHGFRAEDDAKDGTTTPKKESAALQALMQRLKIRRKGKFYWVIRDKDKFKAAIEEIRQQNLNLFELLGIDRSILAVAVAAYTVPNYSSKQDVEWLKSSGYRSVSDCSSLKLLEATPIVGIVPDIKLDAIVFEENHNSWSRGRYKAQSGRQQNVLLEWKRISTQLTVADADAVNARIQKLGELLCTPKSELFRIPKCIGICEESSHSQRRRAFVYEDPSTQGPHQMPVSLSTLLEAAARDKLTVDLGDRFRIAAALAATMSLLHSSKWLHKSLRSEVVLFFEPWDAKSTKAPIESLFVAGFEYSRPDLPSEPSIEVQSLTGNPDVDIYRHPDVFNGFQWQFDVYSLGVVLWEIAIWRPLKTRPIETMQQQQQNQPVMSYLQDMTAHQRRDALVAQVDALGGVVGRGYRDAVRTCLTGDLGAGLNDAQLARAFLDKVVTPLQNCIA